MKFDEAVTEISSEAHKREHWNIPLSEMTIDSTDAVEIDGNRYSLTGNGKKTLCKLLEVPANFYQQLNADDEELWKHMVTQLEKLKDTNIRFTTGVNPDKTESIHGFNKASTPWMSNEAFLGVVDYYLKHSNKQLELKHIMLRDNAITAQLHLVGREATIAPGLNDIFKFGLNLSNSEIVLFRSSIEHALERLVCTNRASVSEKGFMCKMTHVGSSEALIQNYYQGINRFLQQNISVEQFLRERLGEFRNCNASLSELETVYNIGQRCAENIPDRLAEFDSRVPLKKVVEKYGLEFPLRQQKSNKWKSTASTPVNLYDLYNNATWIASNAEGFTEDEMLKMQIEIGRTFLDGKKKPDLLDIAPAIVWN